MKVGTARRPLQRASVYQDPQDELTRRVVETPQAFGLAGSHAQAGHLVILAFDALQQLLNRTGRRR
jgi:hypothetical protein